MGLRVVAAFATAAIAIALVAAFLVSHRPTVGMVNAGQDSNLKAYESKMASDYNVMNGATSNNCNTIQDKQCALAVSRVIPRLQSWADDLGAPTTPANFKVLDAQLRAHLLEVITELNAAVAFQKANDETGFNLAMDAALYERGWVDPTSFELDGTYPRLTATYAAAVAAAKLSLDNCINGTPAPADFGCAHLGSATNCPGPDWLKCDADVQGAETQIQGWLIALAQNPPPAAKAASAAKLQTDLAKADTALLAITDALLKKDAGKAQAARSQFTVAIGDAQSDNIT